MEALKGGGKLAGNRCKHAQAALPAPPSAAVSAHEDELITPTKLRQIIARRMAEFEDPPCPHFYVTHEYRWMR